MAGASRGRAEQASRADRAGRPHRLRSRAAEDQPTFSFAQIPRLRDRSQARRPRPYGHVRTPSPLKHALMVAIAAASTSVAAATPSLALADEGIGRAAHHRKRVRRQNRPADDGHIAGVDASVGGGRVDVRVDIGGLGVDLGVDLPTPTGLPPPPPSPPPTPPNSVDPLPSDTPPPPPPPSPTTTSDSTTSTTASDTDTTTSTGTSTSTSTRSDSTSTGSATSTGASSTSTSSASTSTSSESTSTSSTTTSSAATSTISTVTTSSISSRTNTSISITTSDTTFTTSTSTTSTVTTDRTPPVTTTSPTTAFTPISSATSKPSPPVTSTHTSPTRTSDSSPSTTALIPTASSSTNTRTASTSSSFPSSSFTTDVLSRTLLSIRPPSFYPSTHISDSDVFSQTEPVPCSFSVCIPGGAFPTGSATEIPSVSLPLPISTVSGGHVPTSSGMYWSSWSTTMVYTTTMPDGQTSVVTTVEPTGSLVPDAISTSSPHNLARNRAAVAGVVLGTFSVALVIGAWAFTAYRRRVRTRDAAAALAAAHNSFRSPGPGTPGITELGGGILGGGVLAANTLRGGTVRNRPMLRDAVSSQSVLTSAETGAASRTLSIPMPVPVPGGRILSHAEMESIASEDGHITSLRGFGGSGSSVGHGGGFGASFSSSGHGSDEPLTGAFREDASRSAGSHSRSGNSAGTSHGAGSNVPWWQAGPSSSTPVITPEDRERAGFRASLRARLRTASGKLLSSPPSAVAALSPPLPPPPKRGEWDDDPAPLGGLSPPPPSSPSSSSHGHGHPEMTFAGATTIRRASVQRPPVTPLFSRMNAPSAPPPARGPLPTRRSVLSAAPSTWGGREWPAPAPGLTLPPAVDASPAPSAHALEGLLDPRLTGTTAPWVRAEGGMASATSFADAVDYSRPIGAYVAQRAYSSRTFGSMDTSVSAGSSPDASAGHGHGHAYTHSGSLLELASQAHATPGHEPAEDEVMYYGRAE